MQLRILLNCSVSREQKRIVKTDYPPYSPDLTSCDCLLLLFRYLKNDANKHWFRSTTVSNNYLSANRSHDIAGCRIDIKVRLDSDGSHVLLQSTTLAYTTFGDNSAQRLR
ncbi:hypothetical protein EVAR_63105_1 [Eumeta japonica]|uniref:Uncharacterized protein n=1 Tax=Eumeta variegata TaxID=151549 RepID=A0A4C1ZDV2_EUMVA|nr:hypothetical protein EVAR_63105_1 [Eumeta japonica]